MPPKRRTQEQKTNLALSGQDIFKKYRRKQLKKNGDTSRWQAHEERLNNEWHELPEEAKKATEQRLKDGIRGDRRLSDISGIPVRNDDVEDTPAGPDGAEDGPVEPERVEDTSGEPTDLEIFKQHRRARIERAGDRRSEHVHEARLNAQWHNMDQMAQNTEVQRIRDHIAVGTAIADISDAEGAEPPQVDAGDLLDSENENEIVDDAEDSSLEGGDNAQGGNGEGAPEQEGNGRGEPEEGDEESEEEGGSDEDDDSDEESEDEYNEDQIPSSDMSLGITVMGQLDKDTIRNIPAILHRRARRNPPNLNSQTWTHATIIGNGSAGVVTLWLSHDENGTLIDRIAVKDQYYEQPEWSSINTWYGDPRNFGTRVLMEVKAMSNLKGHGSIIRILGSRVEMKDMASRIIMSYCGHGDLDGIVEKYKNADVHIPEAFIWAVFHALADACLAMKYGNIRSEKDDAWEQIVHQDINPRNIFMDAAASRTDAESVPRPFPSYQQPVLADFGHSIITSPYDDLNPFVYAAERGTEGFQAPEQIGWIEHDTLLPSPRGKLLSPTNIYQVGVTIAAMMQRETVQPWKGPEWKDETLKETFPDFPDEVKQQYSGALRRLVRKCVRRHPEDRITATQLKRKILKHTGGRQGIFDQAGNMREHWAVHANDLDAALARRTVVRPEFLTHDQYQIQLAAPAQ